MNKIISNALCVLALTSLLVPVTVLGKPSVSRDHYNPNRPTPPPSQQQNPSQETSMYNSNMGADGLAEPITVPPVNPPEAVPEPMTLILFGLGVAGAGVATRLRNRQT